jgi:hypothetical protein
MPPFALEAWIGPLVPRGAAPEEIGSDPRLTLGCPTAFHRDRVRERFLPEIERCAALEAGVPVAVEPGGSAAAARDCAGSGTGRARDLRSSAADCARDLTCGERPGQSARFPA